MTAQHPKEQQDQMVKRYLAGETARAIAKDMGLWVTSVTRVLKRHGIEIRDTRSGENHPSWKGGRILKGRGYIGIWKPDHPCADNGGYVYEHTLVIEEKIGHIPIKGKEAVHHVDLDKLNNDPNNLYLCTNSEHLQLHRQLEQLLIPFIKSKMIVFDHDKGVYELGEELSNLLGNAVTVNVAEAVAKQIKQSLEA